MQGYFDNPIRVLDVFVEPASTVHQLKEARSWILPWLLVTLGTMVVGLASQNMYFDAALRAMPSGTPPEQVQQTLSTMKSTYLLGISLSALLIPLKWLISTSILYTSCVLFDLKVTGRQLFNLLAHCALILLLQDFVSYMALLLERKYVGSGNFVPDFSLNLLIHPEDPIIRAVVGYFSLFNLWYGVVLVLSLAAMLSVSRKKALAGSLPLLILPMVVVIGFGMLTTVK
jgi:hypothetical protein